MAIVAANSRFYLEERKLSDDITPPFLEPIAQIKAAVKKRFDSPHPRSHLGASEIGGACRADLWHKFRWNTTAEFSADTHLKFQDGHRSEFVMADYIRRAGYNLRTADSSGRQFSLMRLGGHFAGSVDGIIEGQMPFHTGANQRTVWEHKATNDSKFKKLVKLTAKDPANALREWDEVYFAQAQVYMHCLNIQHHWLTCSTAGCRDFTAVHTAYCREYAEAMLLKAETIITSDAPFAPAFSNPDSFQAKFLNSRDLLYFNGIPAPTFRNSAFSSPVVDESRFDAAWRCDFLGREVSKSEQLIVPHYHLFIPQLIPFANAIAMEDAAQPRWIQYELKSNGFKFYNVQRGLEAPHVYNSWELQHLTPDLIQDPNVESFRSTLGGTVG